MDTTLSNPITAEYAVIGRVGVQHYCVAYKAGSPDVAGTTRNDLTVTPG